MNQLQKGVSILLYLCTLYLSVDADDHSYVHRRQMLYRVRSMNLCSGSQLGHRMTIKAMGEVR